MARYRKWRFQELPDTTYLLIRVILIEERQYARMDAPGLWSSREVGRDISAVLMAVRSGQVGCRQRQEESLNRNGGAGYRPTTGNLGGNLGGSARMCSSHHADPRVLEC